MRAAVLNDDHELEVADVADPSPGPGELVLAGDRLRHLRLRPEAASRRCPPGLVMGHEFCGEIVATGADTDAAVADRSPRHRAPAHRLRSLPGLPRGRTRALRAGRHGRRRRQPGRRSPSTSASTSARRSALPESLDPALGALVEPLAVGLHAVERAHIRSGDKVLVVGAGPVGLSVIAWAARSGAGELVVSDPSAGPSHGGRAVRRHPHRRSRIGALEPRYDVVIECVGRPGSPTSAWARRCVHGHVVIAGVCTKPDPYVPIAALMKELTIDFVVYYTRREFFSVADALAHGAVDAAAFVSRAGRTRRRQRRVHRAHRGQGPAQDPRAALVLLGVGSS